MKYKCGQTNHVTLQICSTLAFGVAFLVFFFSDGLLRTELTKVDLPCTIVQWAHIPELWPFGGHVGVLFLGENTCLETRKPGHRARKEFESSNSNREKSIGQF
eukprot:EG_transcript_62905